MDEWIDKWTINKLSYMINGEKSTGLSGIGQNNGLVPIVVVLVLALTAVPTLAVSVEQ